ncbi:hypothetical protein [Aquimarina aquimarini]|uniref:hypothetical protein n=1 Tax=Aquimarina aquimarini TaxID=1191734 RepID=UPI000D54B439|nr:hypothetical protein [Aquimarina aquimarini]
MKEERFIRLPKESVLGFKIATRKTVNQRLSDLEAFDHDLFIDCLNFLFGKPDVIGDGRLSYSIRDQVNKIDFEAFSGASGPSYGGTIHHFENIGEAKLLTAVRDTLLAFDICLIEASDRLKL